MVLIQSRDKLEQHSNKGETMPGSAASTRTLCGGLWRQPAAAQAVEHSEIARYGKLIAWAKQLGRNDCAGVLQKNLDEGRPPDDKITAPRGSEAEPQSRGTDGELRSAARNPRRRADLPPKRLPAPPATMRRCDIAARDIAPAVTGATDRLAAIDPSASVAEPCRHATNAKGAES
jgi:hypothetical protein